VNSPSAPSVVLAIVIEPVSGELSNSHSTVEPGSTENVPSVVVTGRPSGTAGVTVQLIELAVHPSGIVVSVIV